MGYVGWQKQPMLLHRRYPKAILGLGNPVPAGRSCSFLFRQKETAAASCRHGLLSSRSVTSSIEEGHVPHRLGLSLRVQQDLMPAVQGDRGVVGVADAALDVDAGVPPHG